MNYFDDENFDVELDYVDLPPSVRKRFVNEVYDFANEHALSAENYGRNRHMVIFGHVGEHGRRSFYALMEDYPEVRVR